MPMDRFLIAPFKTGLQTNVRPWLALDDSLVSLNNAYVFRGRITKRFGSLYTGSGADANFAQLRSRARISLGNTDGSGNLSVTVPGSIFKIGQQFSVADEIFTVTVLGVPGVMKTTGASTVHTYNTTTGALVINGAAAATAAFFYPSEPIMGSSIFTQAGVALSAQPAIVFDTQFAYTFTGAAWQRAGTVVWQGNNNNFFWGANWQGTDSTACAFFASNFHVKNLNGLVDATDDPIYYTTDAATWATFQPFTVVTVAGAVQTTIKTARIVLPFKNRLIMLNTVETDGTNNKNFINRCRFSINGSPFAGTAGNYFAWLEPNQTFGTGVGSGAGFIDAPVEEAIVSAQFIKDRLIVYFEQSTFELAYTQNEILPFVWQKINAELGSTSTFSPVAFDQSVLVMADVGIHACNGANVERIDTIIPSEIVNQLDKTQAQNRVCGIRDYFNEMVYWAFPSNFNTNGATFPDRVMVYNYRNNTWAFNDDCITTFGYFEQQAALVWSDAQWSWESEGSAWNEVTEEPDPRSIIMGNPQGFIILLSDDENQNASNMPITNMVSNGNGTITLTIIDNNLKQNEWITIDTAQGIVITSGNNATAYVVLSSTTTTVTLGDNPNSALSLLSFTGTYNGGGTSSRVSRVDILTKPFNPYVEKGRNVFISKIDFGVLTTDNGAFTVDYFPSYTNYSTLQNAEPTILLGTGVLETTPYSASFAPLESEQSQLWHPVYLQTEGEAVQLRIYFSDAQMANVATVTDDFEIEGMILSAQSTSRLQ